MSDAAHFSDSKSQLVLASGRGERFARGTRSPRGRGRQGSAFTITPDAAEKGSARNELIAVEVIAPGTAKSDSAHGTRASWKDTANRAIAQLTQTEHGRGKGWCTTSEMWASFVERNLGIRISPLAAEDLPSVGGWQHVTRASYRKHAENQSNDKEHRRRCALAAAHRRFARHRADLHTAQKGTLRRVLAFLLLPAHPVERSKAVNWDHIDVVHVSMPCKLPPHSSSSADENAAFEAALKAALCGVFMQEKPLPEGARKPNSKRKRNGENRQPNQAAWADASETYRTTALNATRLSSTASAFEQSLQVNSPLRAGYEDPDTVCAHWLLVALYTLAARALFPQMEPGEEPIGLVAVPEVNRGRLGSDFVYALRMHNAYLAGTVTLFGILLGMSGQEKLGVEWFRLIHNDLAQGLSFYDVKASFHAKADAHQFHGGGRGVPTSRINHFDHPRNAAKVEVLNRVCNDILSFGRPAASAMNEFAGGSDIDEDA